MRTKADWLFIIEDQQHSGLSIAEYCRLNAIPAYGLYNARTRYGFTERKEEKNEETVSNQETENEEILTTEAESIPSDVCFIPVQIEAAVPGSVPRSAPPGIKEDFLDFFCNGIRLTLPPFISDAALTRLIRACAGLC